MSGVFIASFLLVAPFWLLMLFSPGWRRTAQIVRSPWIAAPAALLYTALVLSNLISVLSAVANPNLAAVMALLSTPLEQPPPGYTSSPSTCL